MTYYNGSNYTFTWSGGQLTGAVRGSNTLTFTYNDEGIRTSKTNNGVKTTYYLSGSQIVAEETSNNIILYIYDSQGSPIGMQYHGANYAANVWDTFWFEKNLQGDIVAVYSGSGTKLVEYVYDAWGNHITNYFNGGASTQASNNPFRYRGYYYDSDLELYCVGTRYYDSVIGRWINADSTGYLGANGDLTSYNLYAYCSNNPINNIDLKGNLAISISLVIGGVIAGCIFGGLFDAGFQLNQNGGDFSGVDWGSVINSSITGAALGLSTALGVGYLGQFIARTATFGAGAVLTAFSASVGTSAVAGGAGYVVQEAMNERLDSVTFSKILGHAGIVALEGAFNFGIGGIVGSMGPTIGENGRLLSSKEWYLKFAITQEFSNPLKIPLNKLRKEIWR